MGLLSKKDNELNAGKALESMMDKFDIDLDEIEEVDKDNSNINKRRKEKDEKEKLGY